MLFRSGPLECHDITCAGFSVVSVYRLATETVGPDGDIGVIGIEVEGIDDTLTIDQARDLIYALETVLGEREHD